MRALRVLAAAAIVVMATTIIFGVASGDFLEEGRVIWALAWGKVALIDLYVGLAMFGGWIAFRERRPLRVAWWWLALVVTGNLGAAVYLLVAALQSSNPGELLLGPRARVE